MFPQNIHSPNISINNNPDQCQADDNDISSLHSIDNNHPQTSSHSSVIIDTPSVPYGHNMREPGENVIEIRDSLFTHKDNILYFVTGDNQPLSSGAVQIAERYGLPPQ